VTWKSAPLFPGYLFVSLDPGSNGWHPIQSTYGVSGLVRFGDRPAILPQGLVERLQRLSGEDGVLSGTGPGLSVGDRVRLEGGPFDAWIGEVIACPDAARVSLLLNAAHRSIIVTVDRSAALLVRETGTPALKGAPL
jgi:transcription antitermination factor NusG